MSNNYIFMSGDPSPVKCDNSERRFCALSSKNIEKIINAGVEIATQHGPSAVTAKRVAAVAGVSRQTVHNNFVSSHAMRDEVLRECIKREVLSVIAILIVTKHPVSVDIPDNVRQRALANV